MIGRARRTGTSVDSNSHPESDSFAALLDLARAALKSGNTAEAIERSDALIDAYAHNSQPVLIKARALARASRLDEAVDALEAGLNRVPDDLKLLNMARNFALQANGYDSAVEFARRIARIAPGDLKNRAFLVQYQSNSKAFDDALQGAVALLADFPSEPLPWILKVQVLLVRRDMDAAHRTIDDALRVHPGNPKLLMLGRYVASLQGKSEDALQFASLLAEVAPADFGNRIFLAAAKGDFEEILRCSDELIASAPRDLRSWIIKTDALVALHRIDDAFATLDDAVSSIGRDPRLLAIARNVAFAYGRFSDALRYALELLDADPRDHKNEAVLLRCWTAVGSEDEIRKHFADAGPRISEQPLRKAARNFREMERLKRSAPAIVAAWREALDCTGQQKTFRDEAGYDVTTIQYWSQGRPPADVELVISKWKDLVRRERIGDVQVFDRSSAEAWIDENAPEFARSFSKSFHYAMEADIFRLAYASRRACIYADVDDWPLENAADIIKFALGTGRSALLFRSYKPWISNGFFISTPGCPYFRALVEQALAIDLDEWPKNRTTIGKTFGPWRYNAVLTNLASISNGWTAAAVDGLPGCSRLEVDAGEILFSHEAALAALKPPFALGYKATDAYWKKMAGK